MSDFLNQMKTFIDKGVDMSKDVLTKAGNKAQDLGAKGASKIEVMQLQKKAEKEFLLLGMEVYSMLVVNKEASISSDNAEISGILDEITRLKTQIEGCEVDLKK